MTTVISKTPSIDEGDALLDLDARREKHWKYKMARDVDS